MFCSLLIPLSPEAASKRLSRQRKSGGMQTVLTDIEISALINIKMAQRPSFDWNRVSSWDVEPIFLVLCTLRPHCCCFKHRKGCINILIFHEASVSLNDLMNAKTMTCYKHKWKQAAKIAQSYHLDEPRDKPVHCGDLSCFDFSPGITQPRVLKMLCLQL